LGIFISLLVLSALIIIHELGHFLTARFFGVKVEEFGLGLPIGVTKPWFARKFGETTYSFYPVFIGGFVKMKGQNDTDPSEKSYDSDSYNSKTPIQKIAILFAGPFANFFLAFVIYLFLSLQGVPTLKAVVGQIAPDSAALSAGLKSSDEIVSINSETIKYWDEIPDAVIKNGGSLMDIKVKRDGKIVDIKLAPKEVVVKNIFGEEMKKYMIGISPSGASEVVYYGFSESVSRAAGETYHASKFIAQGIQKLFTGVVPMNNVGGIVSIVQVTSSASAHGIASLLVLMALISVNLGVVNLLPIPALDGGHIIFNLYEMIFRRTPNENIALRLTYGGWAFLLALMMLGLYNDINRILG
jgi:regulator of sigma E protease